MNKAAKRSVAHPAPPQLLSVSLLVFAVVFSLLLLGAGDGVLRDADIFWHIEVGRRILQIGSFPWIDELSFTFEGHRWIAKEWLSQVILALVYRAGGWPAVVGLVVSAVALTFTLIFFELARCMRVVPALCIVFFFYAFATPHFVARPHLLSYPIAVLWVGGLVRAVEAGEAPRWALLVLMTIWANLHGGFTLGLVLAGLLALEAVSAADCTNRSMTALRWAAFLAAAVLASLLTPYGYHSVLVTGQVFGGNEALGLINEWRPVNFGTDLLVGPLIIGAIFFALLSGVKIKPIRLIAVTGLFYLMLIHIRFASVFAVIAPLLIASSLARQFPYIARGPQNESEPLLKHLGRIAKPVYGLAFAGVIVGSLLLSLYARGVSPHSSIHPVAAVDYVLRTDPSGRVYNDYSFGGYLIFRGIKTFIDGRSDQLFGGGFMARAFQSARKPNNEFLELLDEYKITSAIVEPASNESVRLGAARHWQRRYDDKISVVYQRMNP
jgi:hypothetical protein